MAFESLKVSDVESFKRCRSEKANLAILAKVYDGPGMIQPTNHQITQKISRGLDALGYTNGKPNRRKVRQEIVTEYVYLGPFDWIKYKCRDWDWRMGLRRRARAWYSFARNVFGV